MAPLRRVPTLAVAALLLLVAGCNEPRHDGNGTTSPPPSLPPSMPPTTPPTVPTAPPGEPVDDFQSIRVNLRDFLLIHDRPENWSVRIFQTEKDRDFTFDRCAGGPGEGDDGREYLWYGVWNRTGMVTYEIMPTYPYDEFGLVDVSIQLPEDPPYLWWTGATCLGVGSYEFHSSNWELPVIGRGDSNRDLPGAIDMAIREPVSIHVPAGASEADGYLSVEGDFYMIELQAIVGSWEASNGPMLGEVAIYEPGADDWFIRNWWTLADRGWDRNHGETGAPGEYRYHLKLMAPAAMDTDWTGYYWGIHFQEPNLRDMGFQTPFKAYT
jgi:hypothetical protein